MSGTLVDTNVLLDLFANDPDWADWSIWQLEAAALKGPLAINDVVYAEVSVRSHTIEALDALVFESVISLTPIPRRGLFLAGKAFQRYRAAGSALTGVLPDFLISAHAAVIGMTLLSRDAQRYRTYFPALDLVTP